MKPIRYYYERVILYLLFIIGTTLILTVINAIFHYPEVYEFWGEPLSRLGGITSTKGSPNDQSSAIFANGLQLISFLCLCLGFAYIYWVKVIQSDKNPESKYHPNYLFAGLSFVMAIGALLLAVPYDHPRDALLHALGTLMFILGFCVFNLVAQLHRRKRKTFIKEEVDRNFTLFELILIILLFGLMVVYIFAFSLDRINNYEVKFYNYFNSSTQKTLIIICLLAIFNLDADDVLLPDERYRNRER